MQRAFRVELTEDQLNKLRYAYDGINEVFEDELCDGLYGRHPQSRSTYADWLVEIMNVIESFKEVPLAPPYTVTLSADDVQTITDAHSAITDAQVQCFDATEEDDQYYESLIGRLSALEDKITGTPEA